MTAFMSLSFRKTSHLYSKFFKPYLDILKIYRPQRVQRFKSTMSSQEHPLVAVCQLTSTSDKEKNFDTCKTLIEKAKSRGAKMVFLPECVDYLGESKKQSVELAEPLSGPLVSKYRDIAKTHGIWLSLGGLHEKGPASDSRRVNVAHVIISEEGDIAAVYRKIHIFDIDTPDGLHLRESDYTIPGTEVAVPVKTPVGNIGLGICYDLRFPEFSLSMVKAGANILTYPSAFTQTTGMAHWESLLRSRAIESQCYVIAAAQIGRHNPKRSTYGRAMIVDPWGCIVACCSDSIGIAMAEINLDYVQKVRNGMPIWMHRRPELYGSLLVPQNAPSDICEKTFMFGPITLQAAQLFYKTQHSMGFVNKKPVIPGHVLVSPLRCVKKLLDLSPHEVADLFTCVQKVQKAIETEYNTSSSTVSIQDGPDAGQTIPHVHVHVLPRKPGDFQKDDDIYVQLETHDKTDDRKWREEKDMAQEAEKLRKYFY